MAYAGLPIDEEALIAQLHDPKTASAAFDTLMRMYGEPVYWQIRKLVVRHEDADDILQNVFLKAWNNLQNFRETQNYPHGSSRSQSMNRSISFTKSAPATI